MIVALVLSALYGSANKQSNLQIPPQHSASQPGTGLKQETLVEVLVGAGLKAPVGAVKDLNHAITSYAVLNDHDIYLIAYYWNLPSGRLDGTLRVLSFNRQSGEWKSAQLIPGSEEIGCQAGDVLRAHALPGTFLLDTHINPSAGCLLVLKRDLTFQNALYGWYLTALSNTQIVFQRSEVHFAPEHPAELAIYDLETSRETPLFPREPFQDIRRKYIQQLREFYRAHEEWCNKNDDPCDPESVDSALDGAVVVNEREHALAFIIDYNSYDRFRGDSAGPVQRPVGPGKVVYIYRHVDDQAKLDYREMYLTEVESRFGKLPLRSLLEPATLSEIFAASHNEAGTR